MSSLAVSSCLAGSLTLVGLGAGSAQASQFWITSGPSAAQDVRPSDLNQALTAPGPLGAASASARYRLSQTNWDSSLSNRGDTSVNGNYPSANMSTVDQLNNKFFTFSLKNIVGQGFIWSLTDNNTMVNTVMAWGSGFSPPIVNSKPTINGPNGSGALTTPTAPFNSISIRSAAGATGTPSNSCGLTGVESCFSISTISFSAPGFSKAGGSWVDSKVSTVTGSPGTAQFQQLYSDKDLSTFNWELTGTLQAYKGANGCEECVRLDIATRNVSFSTPTPIPAPAPGPLPVLGAAMAFGWSRSLRKRIATAKAASQQS